MKNKTLHYIILSLTLLLSLQANAQRYYPKLNNLFLENSGDESLFNDDINYFREGLRAVNNKLFYGNMQISTNDNAAFVSMKMIPRFITEFNLLESGMVVKFNATSKEEYPSFPVTYQGYTDTRSEPKTGHGRITIGNRGLSVAFENSQVTALNDKGKKDLNTKAEFVISDIEYTFEPDSLIISLTGDFTTDVKVKKSIIKKNNFSPLIVTVKKGIFFVSYTNLLTGKEIILLEKKV